MRAMSDPGSDLADELLTDVQRLAAMLDETVRGREGDAGLTLVDELRRTADRKSVV